MKLLAINFLGFLIFKVSAYSLRQSSGKRKPFNAPSCSNGFSLIGKTSDSATSKSMVHFVFNIENGSPVFRIVAALNGETGLADTKSRSSFRVEFEGLLEVNGIPSTGNLTFDSAEKYLPFKKMDVKDKAKWSKTNCSEETVSGSTIYRSVSTLKFSEHTKYKNLNLTLEVKVSDSFIKVNSGTLDPNGLKYSLYIDGWPYSQNTSHLALVKSIWAKSKTSIKTEDSKELKTSTNGELIVDDKFGIVDWDSTISADGISLPVVVSNLFKSVDVDEKNDDEDKLSPQLLAFHFPRANTLIWDPYIGLSSEYPGVSNAALNTANFLMIFAILAIVLNQ